MIKRKGLRKGVSSALVIITLLWCVLGNYSYCEVSNDLQVTFLNQNKDLTTNSIQPKFKLTNNGSQSINLSDIKLKYFFTKDDSISQTFFCDYSTIGPNNITGTFQDINPALPDADCCLTIGFKTESGILLAGNSIEVITRFSNEKWSYIQSNDYSFKSSGTDYSDWSKITVYHDGSLIAGTEPQGAFSSIDPTYATTNATQRPTPPRNIISPTPTITSEPMETSVVTSMETPTPIPTPIPTPVDFTSGIGQYWSDCGGTAFFGNTLTEAFKYDYTNCSMKFQIFEKAVIVYSDITGSVHMSRESFTKWTDSYNTPSYMFGANVFFELGLPTATSYTVGGVEYTEFQGGMILNNLATGKQYIIYGGNYLCYNKNKDNLGLPLEDQVGQLSYQDANGVGKYISSQKFEKGTIYHKVGVVDSFALWGKIDEAYKKTDVSKMYDNTPVEDLNQVKKDSNVICQKCKFETSEMYYFMKDEPITMDGKIAMVYESHGGVLGWLGLPEKQGKASKTIYYCFENGIIVSGKDGTCALKDLCMNVTNYTAYGSDGWLSGDKELYVKGSIKATNGYNVDIYQPKKQGRESIDLDVKYNISDKITPDLEVEVYLKGMEDESGGDRQQGIIERKYTVNNCWGYFDNSFVRNSDSNFSATYRLDSRTIPYDATNFRKNIFWSFSNFSTNALTYSQYASTFMDVENDESRILHPFNSFYYKYYYKSAAKDGNCYGMCLEALNALSGDSKYTEPIGTKYFDDTQDGKSLTDAAQNGAHKGLISDINIRQGSQLGDKVISYTVDRFLSDLTLADAKYAYFYSKDLYEKGQYSIIRLSKDSVFDSGGHAVIPYKWEANNPKYPGKLLIYVADPNKPATNAAYADDLNSVIVVNPNNNEYQYTMAGGSSWHGRIVVLPHSIAKAQSYTPGNRIKNYIEKNINILGDVREVNAKGMKVVNYLKTFGDGDGDGNNFYIARPDSSALNKSLFCKVEPKSGESQSQLAIETDTMSAQIVIHGTGGTDQVGYCSEQEQNFVRIIMDPNSSGKNVDVTLQSVDKSRWIKLEKVHLDPGAAIGLRTENGGKRLIVSSTINTKGRLIYKEGENSQEKIVESVYVNDGNRTNVYDCDNKDGKITVPEAPLTPVAKSGVLTYLSFNDSTSRTSDIGNNKISYRCDFGEGVDGKAVKFNGINQYAVFNLSEKSQLKFNKRDSFSISTWVYVDDPNISYQPIVSKGNFASLTYFDISISNKRFNVNFIQDELAGNSEVKNDKLTGNSAVDKGWNHIAFVQDAESRKSYLYINGVLEDSGVSPYNIYGNLLLGKSPKGTTFKGALDELYVKNYPMSRIEVKKEYDRHKETYIIWNFDETSGTEVMDSTGVYEGNIKKLSSESFNWTDPGFVRLNSNSRDHIVIPSSDSFDFDENDGYMIMARVYIPENCANTSIISKRFSVGIDSSGEWILREDKMGISAGKATPGWHEISIIQNEEKNELRFFIDHKLKGVSKSLTTKGYDITLGQRDFFGDQNFGCVKFDYLEVFNYCLKLEIQ